MHVYILKIHKYVDACTLRHFTKGVYSTKEKVWKNIEKLFNESMDELLNKDGIRIDQIKVYTNGVTIKYSDIYDIFIYKICINYTKMEVE